MEKEIIEENFKVWDYWDSENGYRDYTEEEKIQNAEDEKVSKLSTFREDRASWLRKFDLLKSNVGVGIEQPLTQEELTWYRDILDYPETLKEGITIPERVAKYK